MNTVKTTYGRRAFVKKLSLTSGGILIGFSWLASCAEKSVEEVLALPDEWFEINGFLKIGNNGVVTIMSPNPEIGQNIKTSMPMIVAEELDADWTKVIVEQAPLNTTIFKRQLAGGSQSIRQGWDALRMAGATARTMLTTAASKAWNVPVEEITTSTGQIHHKASGKTAHFGEMASEAAKLEVPEEVVLKDKSDFNIIGNSKKNVDGDKIIHGEPLFGIDTYKDNMLMAMIVHPPAFGMEFSSMDASEVKSMPGITDVFVFDTYTDTTVRQWSDTDAFSKKVAIVGASTWQLMQAKKALKIEWKEAENVLQTFGENDRSWEVEYPKGLESSQLHAERLAQLFGQEGQTLRKDGDPDEAFKNAAKTIERTYSCPFLAHNTLEPMNFYADVTAEQATVIGPIQTPEYAELTLSSRLGLPVEKIDVQMTRMGGGFGRRLYGHFVIEAAVISQKMKRPIKLIYSREDDMTSGVYRPMHVLKYRAAFDDQNKLTALHVKGGGIPSEAIYPNRFPAGAIDHYMAEVVGTGTNISTGAWRAPGSNFAAGAEQSFLDEVAEIEGKDPIDFRLELLERSRTNPVGENNDYDPVRYAEVLKVLKEKMNTLGKEGNTVNGIAAYYCHNSYVAQAVQMSKGTDAPEIKKVISVIDCGIVVNPDAAINMVQGGVIDGIGHAMFSEMTFNEGVPEASNFDRYQLIRHMNAPKKQEVHFVQNDIDPTGLGEPPLPPVIGALANAMYRAKGERVYHQPFSKNKAPF